VGTLRLILALCVAVAYAAPRPHVRSLEPRWAVKAFFLMSGFYMVPIPTEKYPHKPKGRRPLYTDQWLRISPTCLVALEGPSCSTRRPASVRGIRCISFSSGL